MPIKFLFSYSGVVISILCFFLVLYLARDLELESLGEKEEGSQVQVHLEISDGH